MNQVARISYLNARPFFSHWPNQEFPLLVGPPRDLSQAAKEGRIMAGPLPIVDCWDLEDQFEPLGQFGIAVRDCSRSVFVLSQRPFWELDQIRIGVTHESSASVLLCELLIRQKYGHKVQIRRGFHVDDEARLVIGDEALRIWDRSEEFVWAHLTDLATEWWRWQNKPFVFARWVIRKDAKPELRSRLLSQLQNSLNAGKAAIKEIAEQESKRLRLESEKLEAYLEGFIYELGDQEREATDTFRRLIKENQPPRSVWEEDPVRGFYK